LTVSGKYVPPLTVASLATTLVHVPGGQGRQFEEGAVRIDQQIDAFPRGQLPARAVPLDRCLAAPRSDLRRPFA
jgi:hypothetical protein